MAEIKKKLATVKTLAIQKACRLGPKRNPIVTSSLAAYATHSYVCPAPAHVEIRSDFGAIAVIYEIQRCAPVRRRNHTQPSWG